MSSEPPQDAKRPPISSLDVPIDDSGADEAEKKRTERRNQAELPVAAIEALKLKGLGFTIMPLPTNQKAPPPTDWVKSAQNNPAVFLKNPGTHNYAILPPPGVFGWDVDKDVPALIERIAETLGVIIPATATTLTPNGQHRFFHWPADLERPKGPMFGEIVTRWPAGDEGQGYLVGPGSVVVQENGTLGVYQWLDPNYSEPGEDPISDLPRAWAEAALNWKPRREVTASSLGPLAEVGAPKYELPESVSSGQRYAAVLAYTAHLYNRGLSSNEMWPLVQAELAPKFDEAVSLQDLRSRFERAVRDIASRLGEAKNVTHISEFPPLRALPASASVVAEAGSEHSTPSQEALPALGPTPLFVDSWVFADELRSREPVSFLLEGWVPSAGLTVLAGHPKSMKSLAALQMLGAFVAGGEWLSADVTGSDVRVGLYLTREGSHSEMLTRVDALTARHGAALGTRLRFAYEQPIEFDNESYVKVSAALASIESEMSVLPGHLRVMLVLDPLRDLMPLSGDENEAKTMAVVKRWCRSLISDFPFLGIVLVHHLRKSAAGSTGLEMSGSGAMYGAVDSTIIWKARKEDGFDSDDESPTLVSVSEMYGTYRVESRGEAPFTGRWRYDAADALIVPGVGRQVGASGRALPGTAKGAVLDVMRSLGTSGATVRSVAEQCGIGDDNARTQLKRLEAQSKTRYEKGLWYADGFAPFQRDDVILPIVPAAVTDDEEPPDKGGDEEVWDDPLHRL